ncbi:MAG: tetratricopeptide repeat protein [Clostridiales bacterium]|jgi:tetratricopeptide (TPR) repeat protein|nr:tetratricopeptide repeat protein [Clostridiales bacterium]
MNNAVQMLDQTLDLVLLGVLYGALVILPAFFLILAVVNLFKRKRLNILLKRCDPQRYLDTVKPSLDKRTAKGKYGARTAALLNNAAFSHLCLGRFIEAEAAYRLAAQYDTKQTYKALIYNNLADMYLSKGELDDARRMLFLLEQCLAVCPVNLRAGLAECLRKNRVHLDWRSGLIRFTPDIRAIFESGKTNNLNKARLALLFSEMYAREGDGENARKEGEYVLNHVPLIPYMREKAQAILGALEQVQ